MDPIEREFGCGNGAAVAAPPSSITTEGVRSATRIAYVVEKVAGEMISLDYDDLDIFRVRLALGEAIHNALTHGHKGDSSKVVEIRYLVTPEYLVAEVLDEGPGFDPDVLPNPLDKANHRDPRCGWGVFLIRLFMSWVRYSPRGNMVTMGLRRTGT